MKKTKPNDQEFGQMNQNTVNSEQISEEQNAILETTLDILFASEPNQKATQKALDKLGQTMENIKMHAIYYGNLEHELVGTIYLAIRNSKLIAVDFGISETEFIRMIEKYFGQAPYFEPEKVAPVATQVQAYLDGQQTHFDIPCDLSGLTPFQQQVLMATLEIPRGQILTYGDLAIKIGNPKSVRAVGQALGRNPIPIVIPCHRVIAANGSLGGYSGGGGLETKAKLLQIEGALMG